MCRVDSICDCNFGDEGDDDDTASTISSSIRIDNIERDATGTVNSIYELMTLMCHIITKLMI